MQSCRLWRMGLTRSLLLSAMLFQVLAENPRCEHSTCSGCIRSHSCVWCSKEDFAEPQRCSSREGSQFEAFERLCRDFVVNPDQRSENVEDEDLSSGTDDDIIIQIKPQRIKMELRAQGTETVLMTYKHLRNYPVDLYYLMDDSRSMTDDKEVLSTLGIQLVESMMTFTNDFRLGFGVFVDKAVLPYVSTVPWESGTSSSCKECDPPFGYKNVLPLTRDARNFVEKVRETKTASNKDFPEGAFDALMQAIVCKKEIDWRPQSIRLIVIATDAGFHIAGDGKLAGITEPNDKICHLDGSGLYTHSSLLDYPSVSQIREKVNEHDVHLIFAVTQEQEPLYALLQELIPRTSHSILASDSSNIIDILTSALKDIITRVTLTHNLPPGSDNVNVQIFSKCKSDVLEETSTCGDLEAGDEVEFSIQVTLRKCPADEKDWNTTINISLEGRKSSLIIDLSMLCQCQCEKPGGQGFIGSAPQCNGNGDFECGMCSCHGGFIGQACECKLSTKEGRPGIAGDFACRETNTSEVCSGQGKCVCGECVCDSRERPEKIWGKYCQCTNYKGCSSLDGLICSNNGECDCNACICYAGWTGRLCDCQSGTQENCRNPRTKEICSEHGTCQCNHCKCDDTYFGKFCEDCSTCTGKCGEYRMCVECQAFESGELSPEECQTNCTIFNSTKVSSLDGINGGLCTFSDENNCRLYFKYQRGDDGRMNVWVLSVLECPKPLNILYVVLGILVPVVLLGLGTLIVWRIITSIHDKREYAKFILEQKDAKWNAEESPIYKPAVTTINNPLFGKPMD